MKDNKKYIETPLLIIIDTFCISVIFSVAFLIRKYIMPSFFHEQLPEITTMNFNHILWIAGLWFFFLYYGGLYTKKFSFWDELGSIWKVVFFASVASFALVFIGKISDEISRSLLILSGIVAIPLLPIIRINLKKILRRFGLFKRKALIIGSGELGRITLKALRREPHHGYEVVGFIDDNPVNGRIIDGIKVHNGIDHLERYLAASGISDIFIALPDVQKEKVEELINRIHLKVERILLVPDLKSIPMIGMQLHHFFQEQILSLEIKSNLLHPHNIFLKRSFDLLISLIIFSVCLLPMIVIYFSIMLSSPGKPMFTQCRVGKNGRQFKIYKFRTMYIDAEERLKILLEKDENLKREWETNWKLKNDPRITKIGAFLRKTSLDELPQFLNVIRGEMSLVGPRPVTQEEINKFYKETAELCFLVPPGITGLWQISGRSDMGYSYRIALDAWYVRNWSIWLDIVILLKTVSVVLRGEGAY